MSNTKRSVGHIKKIGENKYLLRLSLGYDDFGKRIQPSKVVECKSDREAERQLIEFSREREKLMMKHNSYVPQTLGQLYAYWYENYVKSELKRTTAEWYNNLWNKHLSFAEQLKLESIMASHIHLIIDKVEGERTKNAVFKMIKTMLNKAVRWGFVPSNPCNNMDTPKYKAPEKKALSTEQMQMIMERLKDEPLKYQAIYYFAVICSLRRQAVIGLKWDDIDFKNNTFKVNRAAIQLTGVGTVTDEPKTEKSKVNLHLPQILKDVLIQLRKEQLVEKMKWGDKWIDDNYIFTQKNGKLMCLATPSHWWDKISEELNVEDVTYHGLRHTAATHMIKNNVPISTVSGVLGHANITTTLNTYTHVIEDTKKTAISVMENVVTNATSELSHAKEAK